ncbi:hypothetical protein [Polaromonas sp. CG9_12]|uniref:hypothetical protein n=1 Tax=Polaromonas sp. CG_9.11 TaxID=2787730 RepID=UPI0004DDC859|nr:hypothetical protein [Polaromonas sp. CG_9.11]MBG6075050.1 hypothetical protein [Polaromonas sp. CG_9.11]CDS55053.1 hypothetical protein [Polaromonas sp. CG9_12]
MTVQETPQAAMMSAVPLKVSAQQVEAARYAVLRRLAPCLRHHMVRPLQPIGLIYGVMHHKLSAAQPDLPSVREEAEKINEFAKAALEECMDMGTWLAPEPDVVTDVESGVRECVGLMATMLHFCGFRLVNEVEELPAQVLRDPLRMVLSAALFELTDAMDQPATVTIHAQARPSEVTVTLQVDPLSEGQLDRYDDGYRKLVWADVQALALSERVGLSRQGCQVSLRFAVAPAPVH